MSLVLWMSRKQHAPATQLFSPASPCQRKERKRLQKPHPRRNLSKVRTSFPFPFPDLPTTCAPPAYCCTFSLHDETNETKALKSCPKGAVDGNRRTKIFPIASSQPETQEIFVAELECPSMPPPNLQFHFDARRESLRTRSKTPVFAIGQLEHDRSSASTHFVPLPVALEDAEALAEQYQSILPMRADTPLVTTVTCEPSRLKPRTPRRTLRKIKSQQSLRSLASFSPMTSASTCSSESDTLVGLELPLASPALQKHHNSEIVEPWVDALRDDRSSEGSSRASSRPSSSGRRFSFDMPTPLNLSRRESQVYDSVVKDKSELPSSIAADEVGLNICLNLLTDELATAFFRQHPSEGGNRASGLQILLMIEAYEAVQKQLREQSCRNSDAQMYDHEVEVLEGVLDQWLEALYTLYEGRKAESDRELRGV